MKIELKKATIEDAPKWLSMQAEAYAHIIGIYGEHDFNPAIETLEKVVSSMNLPGRENFFILKDGEDAGAVRISWRNKKLLGFIPQKGKKAYRLGNIFILPQFRNGGIGQIVMNTLEARYPDAAYWELGTILQDKRNIYFYEKLGYKRTGKKKIVNDKLTLVFYKKSMKKPKIFFENILKNA